MMTTLRKYMKHILWIVALAFIATIVFSWGMGGFKDRATDAERGVVGIINGRKIQYQQFAMAYEQQIKSARDQAGTDELSEYQINAIRGQVWETMVEEILFADEIKRLKIRVTADEVVFNLRNNPPDFIRSDEQFQTDGQFDVAKYQQALGNPQNYEAWIPLENYLRSVIPMTKLQQRLLATVRVTDDEAREAYRLENERVNVRYIFFDPNDMPLENILVTDSNINAYYKQHEEEYREPEKRKIEYVLLEGKPSIEDSTEMRNEAQDLLRQIKDGANFEELAITYSKDTGTASKGGDLGFFGKGVMLKPFEDATFSANVGDIIGPVETQFGLHIIEILATKIEEGEKQVHARHILLKYETSPETTDALNEKADYFHEEVMRTKGKQFSRMAELEGLTVMETPYFQKGGIVPGIGMATRISNLTFEGKVGVISNPVMAGNNIVVFRISDIQKARVRPLDEVKTAIHNTVQREKQKNKAGELCTQIRNKIDGGQTFEAAASEDSLEIKETGMFTLPSYISGVGRDPKFAGAAFRLRAGDVSGPVDGRLGYYLIKIIDRTTVDENAFAAEKENLKRTLLQRKQQTRYVAWYSQLKERANIKDYRTLYF